MGLRLEELGANIEYNIKNEYEEIRQEGVEQIYLPPDNDKLWTPMKPVMNFRLPKYVGNFLTT